MKNLPIQQKQYNIQRLSGTVLLFLLLSGILMFSPLTVSAHCDSYDGPVILDAQKALETENVDWVLKWIDQEQEEEISNLFSKTIHLKNDDKEVYEIVKKHFLETLVRLHRETEGAPYTGLKPAGTTKMIIQLSDQAVSDKSADELMLKLNNHISTVIEEKFRKVIALSSVKDQSPEQGREYVEAYVDYTHTLEALHGVLEHDGGHAH